MEVYGNLLVRPSLIEARFEILPTGFGGGERA
jgi:hypothetical protein